MHLPVTRTPVGIPPRAGRPKSEAKRRAVLTAAGDLFLRHGLAGTSMDAVAAQAGVSKQTVYSHFTNKEELFRAVILTKVEDHGISEASLPGDPHPETALGTLGRRFVHLLLDDESISMHRVVIGESLKNATIAELFYETGPAAARRVVGSCLKGLADAGKLKIPDLRYATAQLLNMLRGEYHMQRLLNVAPKPSEEVLEAHVRRTVRHFLLIYAP